MPAARGELQRFRHRARVPRRLGPVQPLALRLDGRRAGDARLLDGELSRSSSDIIMLNVRIATPPPRAEDVPPGIMSSYIFSLKPGDKVTISGPFGEFFARDTDAEMVFIGGGAGMAPMRSHIFDQLSALADRAQDHVLVRRAQPARDLLHRGLRPAAARDTRTSSGIWRCPSRSPRTTGPATTGFIHKVVLRRVPEEPPGARGQRVLPVRAAADDHRGDRGCSTDLGVERDNILFDDFGL